MKFRHAAALALVIVTACAPIKAAIDAATARAENAAQRAEAAAIESERAANLATQAADHTKSADYLVFPGGGSSWSEGSAMGSAMKANDAVSRMEVVCDSCSKVHLIRPLHHSK